MLVRPFWPRPANGPTALGPCPRAIHGENLLRRSPPAAAHAMLWQSSMHMSSSLPVLPFALGLFTFGCAVQGCSSSAGSSSPDDSGVVAQDDASGDAGTVGAGDAGGVEVGVSDGAPVDASGIDAPRDAGAAVPSDDGGTTALRIADMMEAFGANIFPSGQDGASGETVAGVTAAEQYLVGDSGLTMLFRGYVSTAANYESFGPALFSATGCRFTLCMNIGDTPDPSEVISLAKASVGQGNWVRFIEGGNEPNTNFGAGVQTAVTSSAELSAQQQIYAAVHPLGIPVAAPSVVGSYSGIASYWGSDLAGAVAASDLYNTHLYPNHGGPNGSNQLHDWSVAVSQSDWSGKGGITTEWQPVLYNQDATDDASCAYWTPIMLLSGTVDFQLQAVVWWELFDYSGFTPHSGLFAGDASKPYPAAQVLRAMFALTGDKGAAKHTFSPGKLDVTVTGLPSGENQYAGGRWAVFQNSSPGTFFVFVWNEQAALATSTTTPVTVTFNEGPMAKVVDYSLTTASASPTPIHSLMHVASVKLDLTTEVRVLQVTHP